METLIELGLMAAAAIAVARVLVTAAVRRELRERPVLALAVAAAAVAAVMAIGWSALRAPLVLRAIAVAVAGGWGILALRARPGWGRRRAWPPGSLGLRRSLEAIVDPTFYRQQAARYGPVFKTAQFHRPVVCVVGLARGRELLREHGTALAPAPQPLSDEIPRGFLRYMQPEDYERYGRLFRSAISDGALAAIEPFAAGEARRGLAALTGASARTTGGVGPRAFLDRWLLTVLLRLYFGELFRPEDRRAVEECSRDVDYAHAVGGATERARRALRRFEALLRERAATVDPAADPSVWGALRRLEPAAAGDPTVAGNLFLLLEVSRDSLGGLLAWLVKKLSDAPDWVARVRRAPNVGSDDAAGRAVLETLRLAQSEYVYREVRRPITIGGFAVPRGWLVRICVAESHRLDPPFARPDAFDPDRHLGRRFTASELSPFGLDQHACTGARMSLALGRILAAELIAGFDWTVACDGPPQRGNRHWSHWAPNENFRIVLRERRPS